MKYKLHVPVEQYGFIEVEVDSTPEGSKLAYDEIKQVYSTNTEGLSQKDFNVQIDKYLSTNTMDADAYTNMSKAQQYVIQEIKKSFKRLNKEE